MKFILQLTFLLIFNAHLLAQSDTSNYEFTGYITTNKNASYSYKLIFKILSNNKITGQSITDIYGKNKTVSYIEGYYDLKKKNIFFKEIYNISIPSEHTEEDMCFVETTSLKIKKIKGKTILLGTFTGKLNTGKTCASGNIYLASTELLKTFNINEDSLKNMYAQVDNILKTKQITTLQHNDKLYVTTKNNYINLNVWDGGKVDGDMISIYLNDSLLYNNLKITDKKEVYKINLIENKKNDIKIVAVDEGTIPSNSVNILLESHPYWQPLKLALKKNSFIKIVINEDK